MNRCGLLLIIKYPECSEVYHKTAQIIHGKLCGQLIGALEVPRGTHKESYANISNEFIANLTELIAQSVL